MLERFVFGWWWFSPVFRIQLRLKLTKSLVFSTLSPSQVLCGTKPFPDNMKAKKYKLQEQFFTKKDFLHIMRNLPEEVRIIIQALSCFGVKTH